MAKTSFGIRIDDGLLEKISEIIEDSRYLNISRSEIVETILEVYFTDNDEHTKKTRELIIKRREGRL